MLSRPLTSLLGAGTAVLCLTGLAAAQENVQWVRFTQQPGRLASPGTAISDATTQVFFRTADLDQDDWLDVVAVRKEPAALAGKRPSLLLMNLQGVLTDRTTDFCDTTDAAGDDGFLTPRNTREVAVGDVDGDGWLDLMTANTLSDGDPKTISHPLVLRNLALDGGGQWLGFLGEHARTPQLFTFGAPPKAVAPRMGGVALGDVTGDGALDAYFVDYDTPATGIVELADDDLNDRLLVNDGSGFFTDESASRLTTVQLKSAFGSDTLMIDVNADGLLDIVKTTTLNPPRAVRVLYNNPANVGNFQAMGQQDIATAAPYGMALGNLNNDALMDAVIVDDAADKFRLGTGYDALNRVIWGPLKNYAFVGGSDDGFGRNSYLRDLDDDGWNDVIITDVDGDLPGCNRRLHVYHNTGSVPGDMNLVLKEESEFANSGTGPGWKGVVGLTAADWKGSFDAAIADFDKDGDLDLLLGRCSGTSYWQNELNPWLVCQTDLGFAGPGTMSLSLCGDDLTEAGSLAHLELGGAAPSTPLFIALGLSAGPAPFKGGQLVPFPVLSILSGFVTDGGGHFSTPVPGSAGTPIHVYLQVIVKNGTVFELSNGLDVLLGV